MKSKLYFLAILMCILGGFNLSNLNAQTTTVTIGYDSNPDGGLEWCQVDYILYKYSISQMIYTTEFTVHVAIGLECSLVQVAQYNLKKETKQDV